MAESPTGQERTEPASERRRREAREKGQVPRSVEVISVLSLLAGLLYFRWAGEYLLRDVNRLLIGLLELTADFDATAANSAQLLQTVVGMTALLLAPFLLVVLAAVVFANVAQIGLLFATDPLTPKLERISPVEGFKRIFSRRGINELFKSLVKIVLVSLVAAHAMYEELETILRLSDALGVGQIMTTLGAVSFKVLFRCLLVLIVIAVIDYAVQRNIYETGLRMTRKEVEEELRQMEGDPLIRARFRQLRMQRARQRMMAEVPSAEVVITNPTHVAVALRYDPARDQAPVVVAKGRGYVAQRIRQVALEHRVPIYEDPPLAQALFKGVEIGSYIPPELYAALAEVLAYLHRTRRLRRRVA